MPLKPIKTKQRLEQLKQNPLEAVEYAWRKFNDLRWPEAEPIIMKHPRAAANYAAFNLQERWPEAEPYIKKDKRAWMFYKDMLHLHGRV